MKKISRSVLLAIAATMVGCSLDQRLDSQFATIAVGDSRARAIEVMGTPTSVRMVEVPLVKIEELSWRAPAASHMYVVMLASDRVAIKTVVPQH